MKDLKALGVTHELTTGDLVKIEVDDDHFYYFFNEDFPDGQFLASVTHMLDVAAPVGFGLRHFWQTNTKEESDEILRSTGDRGSKLHAALEDLMKGIALKKSDYNTDYERDAITKFIMFFRFLQPTAFKNEKAVASVSLKLGGTIDFVGLVNPIRLKYLLGNSQKLEIDDTGNLKVKDQYIEKFNEELNACETDEKVIIDWKFSSGIRYQHHKQVALYRAMYNESHEEERPVETTFVWRYSPKHKLGFELKEVLDTPESAMFIYNTYLDMHGGELPPPPEIKVYPEEFKLVEEKRNEKN